MPDVNDGTPPEDATPAIPEPWRDGVAPEAATIVDVHQRLKITDFLSDQERVALTAALMAECSARGLDIDKHADDVAVDAVLRWASRAVFEYALVVRVMERQRGVVVVEGGKKVTVTRSLMESVIADALMPGLTAGTPSVPDEPTS